MEPLWSPVVATGGNPSQIGSGRRPQKQAETVAVGCHRLPRGAHGKGRVDSTSLLLKRGSRSWLRNERSTAASTETHDSMARLTRQRHPFAKGQGRRGEGRASPSATPLSALPTYSALRRGTASAGVERRLDA